MRVTVSEAGSVFRRAVSLTPLGARQPAGRSEPGLQGGAARRVQSKSRGREPSAELRAERLSQAWWSGGLPAEAAVSEGGVCEGGPGGAQPVKEGSHGECRCNQEGWGLTEAWRPDTGALGRGGLGPGRRASGRSPEPVLLLRRVQLLLAAHHGDPPHPAVLRGAALPHFHVGDVRNPGALHLHGRDGEQEGGLHRPRVRAHPPFAGTLISTHTGVLPRGLACRRTSNGPSSLGERPPRSQALPCSCEGSVCAPLCWALGHLPLGPHHTLCP